MKCQRCAIFFVFAILALAAAQEALSPHDFARGATVEPAGDAPLQGVLLPADVYRFSRYEDLHDVRVFNAGGEVLPHAVVSATQLVSPSPRLQEVPAFSMLTAQAEQAEPLPAPAEEAEGLDLGGVLGDTQVAGAPATYLIDASALDQEVQGLRLYWQDTAESFLRTILVESSEDLLTWEPWGEAVILAGLRFGSAQLVRNEILLPPRRASYIRLIRADNVNLPLPELIRAVVELVTELIQEARRWWRPAVTSVAASSISYDLGALLSVDSARFVLPRENTLAQIRLSSSAAAGGGWQLRYEGLIYQLLTGDGEIAATSAVFIPTTDRYWLLELPGGGGVEPSLLELGQLPERLVFLARGEPPFTLAYGSTTAPEADFGMDGLLELIVAQEGEVEIATATLGAPRDLAGERALVSPAAARTRLGLGVAAVLVVMMVGLLLFRRRLEKKRLRAQAGEEA
ncbi:MAG: DUF3999 domain-containing protein [Deinococcota bacterium]|nr:DUF3999 domain-containing protein [Deinococcota bacterium]